MIVAVWQGGSVAAWQCGAGSGSGWVAVGRVDRGDQCGHFGTKYSVAVAVWQVAV
jgi:hypothetical protein